MEYKLNKEWTIKSDPCNLILKRTTRNTAKDAKTKYVTKTVGYYPSIGALYRNMVDTIILDDPSILHDIKTVIDIMYKLADDIDHKEKALKS